MGMCLQFGGGAGGIRPKGLRHSGAQGSQVGDEVAEEGRRQTEHIDSLSHGKKFGINSKFKESHPRIVSIGEP